MISLEEYQNCSSVDLLQKFKIFCNKFKFNPKYELSVGIERERFLLDNSKNIAPISSFALKHIGESDRFGHELSACQLEDRIGPCYIPEVRSHLEQNESILKQVELLLGFSHLSKEVGPACMPFDVSNDPTGRYERIRKSIPKSVLEAACRVIGTHVHIGMKDHTSALHVYNQMIPYVNELCRMGDFSNGERLKLYKRMAPMCYPKPYKTWNEFYRAAVEFEFDSDPRSCWTLIRISIHGTIEFRMFGATENLDIVVNWANKCHELCKEALSDVS